MISDNDISSDFDTNFLPIIFDSFSPFLLIECYGYLKMLVSLIEFQVKINLLY